MPSKIRGGTADKHLADMHIPRVSALGAGGGAAALGLKTNLIAWWELNEASGDRADSHTNGLTLTDNNTVTSNTGIGGSGTAAEMTIVNAEFLSVADSAPLGFTTAFTASFWVYLAANVVNMALLGKWEYQTDGEWVIAMDDGPSNDIHVFIATTATGNGSECRMEFDADMSPTTWYHITAVFDGSQTGDANRLKLYRNGSARTLSVVAGAVPATVRGGDATLTLGKFGGTLERYFGGRMAKVGLWNIALTEAQVLSLYNGGAGRSYSEL